jgi:hypothetical protein
MTTKEKIEALVEELGHDEDEAYAMLVDMGEVEDDG